jgi:malonyl-CoA O-methyltransferase
MNVHTAYDLWAPHYRGDNAVCIVENRLAMALSPPLAGKRLLDAGCGLGLRLGACGAGLAVGVDLSQQMLAVSGLASVAAADVRALPFPDSCFDVIWCRLMIGHLPELAGGYGELSRVCRPGGVLLVTDFHADACIAGHRLTFRDADGTLREITHHIHHPAAHLAAAAQHGLVLAAQRHGGIDAAIRPTYAEAGRLAMYERDKGLNIVAAFLFRKMPS